MRPIRVALGRMPGLLRDIVVEVIGRETDMQVVGQLARDTGGAGSGVGAAAEAGGDADVDELLRDSHANVLIFEDMVTAAAQSAAQSAAGSAGRSNERLLHEHRGLKVLVLSDGGRAAELHWLELRTAQCADVSPDGLVGFIRTSFGRSRDGRHGADGGNGDP